MGLQFVTVGGNRRIARIICCGTFLGVLLGLGVTQGFLLGSSR